MPNYAHGNKGIKCQHGGPKMAHLVKADKKKINKKIQHMPTLPRTKNINFTFQPGL